MSNTSEAQPVRRLSSRYPWVVVGLLWFCGFFNYADRQAVNAVFPRLEKELGLSKVQLGWVASSFMIVYAVSGPLAGFVVDHVSRRKLVALGLGFWSLIAAGTGFARNYYQLLFFRAAEGLGESFYFPASMSLLSDYHGKKTRSRAMSIHQTSVYVGIVGGSLLAGWIADQSTWRMPFWILGGVGCIYAISLFWLIVEPERGKIDQSAATPVDPDFAPVKPSYGDVLRGIARSRPALFLLCAFICANFVTVVLMTWLPTFIHEKFQSSLLSDNFKATAFIQGGSLIGALLGGFLADNAVRKLRGGRMVVQGLGLCLGAPFVFLAAHTGSEQVLVACLFVAGVGKGMYESSIFASLYDVIPAEIRGSAAGLMNTVAWLGASVAPVAVAYASQVYGMSDTIGASASIYVLGALLAFTASALTGRMGKPKLAA